MDDKKALRAEFTRLRAEEKSPEKDRLITERIYSLPRVADADTVLLYASFRSEADTWLLAERLTADGRRIAFPLCRENGIMTFHTVTDLTQLQTSTYGIREPSPDLPQPEITDRTVCIVPGLAFTQSGGRLGYGGGFYDRFLREYPQVYTIAAAYSGQVTDSLPLMPHDIKVKSIATNERMIYCNE